MDIARFARNVERYGFEWLDIKNDHLLAVSNTSVAAAAFASWHDGHRGGQAPRFL